MKRRTSSAEGRKSQSRPPRQASISSSRRFERWSGVRSRSSISECPEFAYRSGRAAISGTSALEHAFDRRGRLPGAVRILDEREAHVPFAQRSESDAGGNRDQSLLEKHFREFERAQVLVFFRQWSPYEHGRLRRLHRPARPVQAL